MAIITNYKQFRGPSYEQVIILPDGTEYVEGDIPEDASIYNVRGLSPKEQSFIPKLIRMPEAPKAPYKPKQVAPLNRAGGIIAKDVRDEMYQDETDPDYLAQVKLYNDQANDRIQIILAYTMVCCVQGCNLTDDEIKEALPNEKVYPNNPNNIEEYRNRLSQISDIILPNLDSRHLQIIQKRIDKLTGIKEADVNFT